MSSILEARGVSFAYGPGKRAINDLNVALQTPRRVCLLGANGVGKSTLMLLLNGTLRPQQGELFVLGQPVNYSREGLHRLRRQVGIVLQDPDDQLFGATVEQDVAFGLLNNGLDSGTARGVVADTLESLGIAYLADRPIHQLSLGEKKRVALAGVLVLQAEIILLDEPTAGLDAAGIIAMLNVLAGLHRAGKTIVISTHDSDMAYEWADEAWILVNGRVAAQGPAHRVLRDRATLEQAHLKAPVLLELGLAIRETDPQLAARPLPTTREQLIQLIQQIRVAPATQ